MSDMAKVLQAWAESRALHHLHDPAAPEDIASAEATLGRQLPDSLRAIYGLTNGGAFMQGNLMIEPLHGQEEFGGLDRLSDDLNRRGPGMPPELLVIGGNGSDLLFALWLPPGTEGQPDAPVIALDVGDETLTLAGTSLTAFSTGWSAFYLMLTEAPRAALDILDVPPALAGRDPDTDDLFADLVAWADPTFENTGYPDPYANPITPDQLRQRFSD